MPCCATAPLKEISTLLRAGRFPCKIATGRTDTLCSWFFVCHFSGKYLYLSLTHTQRDLNEEYKEMTSIIVIHWGCGFMKRAQCQGSPFMHGIVETWGVSDGVKWENIYMSSTALLVRITKTSFECWAILCDSRYIFNKHTSPWFFLWTTFSAARHLMKCKHITF